MRVSPISVWPWPLVVLCLVAWGLVGCGSRPMPTPTLTPIPTYTPTPEGYQPAAVAAAPPPDTPTPLPATPTATPVPATATPTPVPATATPTATPAPPTATPTTTPTPTPTPTPDYAFVLEMAEQFPSRLPDVNEVRIYLYVYGEDSYALENYSLRVTKDGEPLTIQAKSTGGIPGETRPGPSPYTRFANLGAAIFEEPAGVWEVQLVNADREPVGPLATFVLDEGDTRREFYVRYRRK